ncbi:hypothetical protein [Pseudomonas sp. RT6P73]
MTRGRWIRLMGAAALFIGLFVVASPPLTGEVLVSVAIMALAAFIIAL